MTNNNPIPGTLTRAQVRTAARDIYESTFASTSPVPTAARIREAVEKYCDDPTINATDEARIRVDLLWLIQGE